MMRVHVSSAFVLAIGGFAILTILTTLPSSVHAQADGNPHGWDRRRRCDHTDYSPPCGVCEGYGGIPYGDKNEEIHLTSCEPVANASSVDPSTLVKPVWGPEWTVTNYNEVLIGKKTDPFCFNSFPSNDSVGKLCYRPDSGMQTYNSETLRYDLNVASSIGNITSTVIHHAKNLWIINKLPWYAAGVHQCICTTVHQGSDPSTPTMYPVTYNWTEQLFFIGVEKIGIEYIEPHQIEELYHWAFGPHHVWSTGTGEIRRMWQPFNGLQVFPHGTSNHSVDPSLLSDFPPPMCRKKGGATFRIKCDDNGYPVNKTKVDSKTAASQPSSSSPYGVPPASVRDRARARNPTPRAAYKGETFKDMSNTLNTWLKQNKLIKTKKCNDFSATELQELQKLLYMARDEGLDDIYQDAQDNRKLRASLDDLVDSWKHLDTLLDKHHPAEDAHMRKVHRDGHCHEAVMWYVHHVSEDMKEILSATTDISIPLLSFDHHGQSACGRDDADPATKAVCSNYQEQVTCASCHSNTLPPSHAFLRARAIE